ncbi:hypothetical protein, partial [Paracidovorax anthurii]|uniref:hypothetical protein n=1 Tax=Paracidovorax anthurii TaxID=78229 RepID=UPI0039EE9A94
MQPFAQMVLRAFNELKVRGWDLIGDAFGLDINAIFSDPVLIKDFSQLLGRSDVWSLNDFSISRSINDLFSDARNWIYPRDPLVLDLDGDGIEAVGIDPSRPILFDHDGDGTKNATGWIKGD